MDVDDAAEAALVDQRLTAVALEKGEGVSKETARRVVWIWTGEDEDRQSVTVCCPRQLLLSDCITNGCSSPSR